MRASLYHVEGDRLYHAVNAYVAGKKQTGRELARGSYAVAAQQQGEKQVPGRRATSRAEVKMRESGGA